MRCAPTVHAMAVVSRSLVRALEGMLLLAVLYEPVRQALMPTGLPVGGVGGVGGLVNLDGPQFCTRLSGRSDQYCFFPGVFAGFTAMALIVTGLWCAPLILGAARMAVHKGSVNFTATDATSAFSGSEASDKVWMKAWVFVSWLWFLLPLVQFLWDPFFRSGFVAVACAVSLAAAYALSWHLAFVAIPVSDAVAPCLGVPRSAVFEFHKKVGWWTAVWGAVHAVGQMIWFIDKGLWTYIKLSSPSDGENMLYIFGMVTASLLLIHTLIASLRKQQWLATTFKKGSPLACFFGVAGRNRALVALRSLLASCSRCPQLHCCRDACCSCRPLTQRSAAQLGPCRSLLWWLRWPCCRVVG